MIPWHSSFLDRSCGLVFSLEPHRSRDAAVAERYDASRNSGRPRGIAFRRDTPPRRHNHERDRCHKGPLPARAGGKAPGAARRYQTAAEDAGGWGHARPPKRHGRLQSPASVGGAGGSGSSSDGAPARIVSYPVFLPGVASAPNVHRRVVRGRW